MILHLVLVNFYDYNDEDFKAVGRRFMSEGKRLTESFQTTYWLIGRFAEGLTFEDSIAQPPFKANTFNWVLGHILVSRDGALSLLDQAPLLNPAEISLYETGSIPVNVETAVSLKRLLQILDASQTALVGALEVVSSEALAEIFDDQKKQSVGDMLSGLHWHETYHVGQLEILRQVSGEREAFP